MVGTGQTTLIQGGKYGVALDALVPQFCSGEVEDQVVAAFEGEDPDVIVVEGQGALSHPAYLTSAHILRGQPTRRRDRPARARSARVLGDFPMVPMPTVGQRDRPDRDLRRHQGHRRHDQPRGHDRRRASATPSTEHELELGLPATDPLTRPLDRLVDMVLRPSRPLRAQPRAVSVGERPAARGRPRRGRGTTPAPWSTGSAARGIRVTGVTKAALGSPGVAAAMLARRCRGLGDSRRREPRPAATRRLGGAAHADPLAHAQPGRRRRARRADVSLNTEPTVLEAALRGAAVRHGADARRGADGRARRPPRGHRRPTTWSAVAATVAGLPGLALAGHRHQPGLPERRRARRARTWASCPSSPTDVEAALRHRRSTVVSGGNSANLDWALGDRRRRPDQRPAPRRGDPARPRAAAPARRSPACAPTRSPWSPR